MNKTRRLVFPTFYDKRKYPSPCNTTAQVGSSTRLPEVDVHPVVAGHEVAVVGLPVLQLHEHGVVLGRAQQGQRQHVGADRRVPGSASILTKG